MKTDNKQPTIITCTGFYQTGSSIVSDLFSEFDHVTALGTYEYRFLQEPDGVADLEYNLIENPHRHNSSDAIKRFIRYTDNLDKMGYGGYKVFNGNFLKYRDNFIDEIVQVKAHTWWNKDRVDKGPAFVTIDRIYSLCKRILTGNLHTARKFSLLKNREWGYYTDISEEEFLIAVRRFTATLFTEVNKKKHPFVMVDQLCPSINSMRFVRYVDNLKIIVIDRDPRDVYIDIRAISQLGIVPEEVHDFVKWFRIIRKYAKPEFDAPEQVLRINYEDFAYRYEETLEKISRFTGLALKYHTRPNTKVQSERVFQNSNLKEKYKGYEKEIAYIEEELSEYLYPFDTLQKSEEHTT